LVRVGLGSRIARFGFGSDHSNPDQVYFSFSKLGFVIDNVYDFTGLVRVGLEFRVAGYGFGSIHSRLVRLWLSFSLLGFIVFNIIIP
jgi:hypothetical protein